MRDLASLDLVAVGERGQSFPHQLVRIGVGLAQDLGILDEVERLGHHLFGRFARDQLDRLERGLADVDRPDGLYLSHTVELLGASETRNRARALIAASGSICKVVAMWP